MYINVNKRVNTKVFLSAGGDKTENPASGTVIDSGVTDSGAYEFFLVSTEARQGMAMPVRYIVLNDDIGAPASELELLTYKLCFTYYNVNGSIKVPSPVQYAHRLAALIGERAGNGKGPVKLHENFYSKDGLYFI